MLHSDDVQTLYKICKILGVGTVRIKDNQCVYFISNKTDLINKLFPILDKYTLLTTKYLDFLDIKEVINLLNIS